MKVVGFGASGSRSSINQQFATYVAKKLNEDATILHIADFPLPIYTIEEEQANGIPENAIALMEQINEADVLVISLAEHNGSYTSFFKNTFDWLSRHKAAVFEGKKLILLATAPGPRGGLGVLEAATNRFPRHGGEVIVSFSLPHFNENFHAEQGILQADKKQELEEALGAIISEL